MPARKADRPGICALCLTNPKPLTKDGSKYSYNYCAPCHSRYNKSRKLKIPIELVQDLETRTACDICGGRSKKMAIDHCHKTGKIRGVLCGNCNMFLGKLELYADDGRLDKMKAYLASGGVL